MIEQLQNKQIVLFDGVCNFCNASVNFILRHDKQKVFYCASLQSTVGQEVLQHFQYSSSSLDSIILLRNNQLFDKSEAVLLIASHLGNSSSLWKLVNIAKIIPLSIRNYFYDIIAKNRHRILRNSKKCIIFTEEERKRFLE